MRLIPRLTGGELATIDLIFLLLNAGAALNAVGVYGAVTGRLIPSAVLVPWNYALNAASYCFCFIKWLISVPPIPVVRDLKLLRRNTPCTFPFEDKLMSSLWQQEIPSFGAMMLACTEGEGALTIVRRERQK